MPDWEQCLCIVSFAKPKTWCLMDIDNQGTMTDWECFSPSRVWSTTQIYHLTQVPLRETYWNHEYPLISTGWRLNAKNQIRHQQYIKQLIKIDRLGAMSFISALESMQAIHALFNDDFGEGCLHGLEQNDWAALSVLNRYFTHRWDIGQATQVAFSDGVDPKGVLRRIAWTDYIHTDKNEVKYYKLILGADGAKTWATCKQTPVS